MEPQRGHVALPGSLRELMAQQHLSKSVSLAVHPISPPEAFMLRILAQPDDTKESFKPYLKMPAFN